MYDYWKYLDPVNNALAEYKGSDRESLMFLMERSSMIAFECVRHELDGDFHEMRKTWDELRHVTAYYIERLGMNLHLNPYDYAFALTMYAYTVIRRECEEMAS